MQLHKPFEITPRLLPGVRIGGAWVSLEHVGYTSSGRDRYRWYIDLADGTEFSEADLKSGCQGASTQAMFGTLLAFLRACADGRSYAARTGRDSENSDLFPKAVGQWAEENSDEIASLQEVIEAEGAELIED